MAAGPNKPFGSDDDALFGDAEIFFESPTAPSAPAPAGLADGEIPMIAEPLPEMFPEIWQAGIQALVTVTDDAPAAPFDVAEWAGESALLASESALCESEAKAASLLGAAGRAAGAAGDLEGAIAYYDQALGLAPGAPELLRARAQLAESAGDFDGAQECWGRLAEVAENPGESELYRALVTEWTLARIGALTAAARTAMAPGLARSLAIVEQDLLAGRSADAAAAMLEAAEQVGGSLGAVMCEQAARLGELNGDRAAARAARDRARVLEADTARTGFGLLVDAVRSDERSAPRAFAAVAAALAPESRLAGAAHRTAAGMASRQGDVKLATSLYETLAPSTVAAARDRIDFEVRHGLGLDAGSVERLRLDLPGAAGAATLAWGEARSLASGGDPGAALGILRQGLEQAPDAVMLGLLAEDIADASADPETRAAALELWLRVDPARRAEAALALAAARQVIAGEGDANAVRPVLQAAMDAARGSALFWRVAVSDARAGRRADAAATLVQGAESWASSALAPGLRACAAAAISAEDPAAAMAALVHPEVARAFGADARARLAARVGDRYATIAALADAAAGAAEAGRKAALIAERAALTDDPAARAQALGEALAAAPDGPLALALRLGGDETSLAAGATLLGRAANAGPEGSALSHVYRLTASSAAELADDADEALHRASDLVDSVAGDRQAHLALVRAASRLGADRRARVIGELPANPHADETLSMVVAESLVDSGDRARAAVIFRELASGRFASEARRALARGGIDGGRSMPPRLLYGAADETAAVVRAELVELIEAAHAQDWPAVAAAMESGPPHQDIAGPAALHAAATLVEARADAGRALTLEHAAMAAAGDDVSSIPLGALARIWDGDPRPAERAHALGLGVRRFGERGDAHSVATAETWTARLWTDAGEEAGGGRASSLAAEAWQLALAADPACLVAALALRREVARGGDLRAAIDAAEVESRCLEVPQHRVRALLLAAALAEEASRGADAAAGRGRALRLLRAALEVEPAHDAAFEQLRALLEEEGDATALAAALAARVDVAHNPFEVTALRLARAEVLAGKLNDRPGAEQELQAILQKQPEHPRALARLSELHWDGGEWSQAGEVYLRRAVVEREPRTLREIFLRLGHIYGERVPDAKRAIVAFERVRTLEPDNRDALRALSDLYVAEGDTRSALPITDRLVTIEPNTKRRAAFRVRLGELHMRAGDLPRATTELRGAVDALPRDIAAVSALAQLLERTRDVSGRRALLDHTAGLLRHDVDRGGLEPETLHALAGVLTLRERPHAAAAATHLAARLASGPGSAAAAPAGVRARSIEGLRKPEADERSYPPALPHGVRQLFRLVGPLLRPSGVELAAALAGFGVSRSERVGRGEPPRPAFEAVAAELRSGDFDLYVLTESDQTGVLRVEPGTPPTIFVGKRIAALGPAAQRFAAARCLRLVASGLDVLLAASAEEAAAMLVGIVRQFVPEYRQAGIRDTLVDAEAARAARVLPRKLRPQVMPFAVESAGPFDAAALHAAVRDGANAAGLLAAGELPAALTVVLASAGRLPVDGALTLPAIVANPEALALLRFAVSDAYDDLIARMEAA